MKTIKKNGHKVVVCCDQMEADLEDTKYYCEVRVLYNGAYFTPQPTLRDGDSLEREYDCPHCGREIEVL